MDMPLANAAAKPAADIAIAESDAGFVQTESFPVIPKSNNGVDFVRPVKMSDLKKIKSEACKIEERKIKWDEIALGVASLGFGASLSAIASSVKLDSTLGIVFYIVCPIISFSALVFMIMKKLMDKNTDCGSADIIKTLIDQYEEAPNKDGR